MYIIHLSNAYIGVAVLVQILSSCSATLSPSLIRCFIPEIILYWT